MRAGVALGCEVRPRSTWARKNYFYPDLPKGYQISQYEAPICEGGGVTIDGRAAASASSGSTRIHLEEDAGKNLHDVVAGRLLRGGPQPGRRAALRDRERARPAQRRRGHRLPEGAARHPGVPGGERRQPGGGVVPLRRQRVRAPPRRPEAGPALRAQEHELVPLPAAGHRLRGAPPGGAHRGGRDGACRRRASSTRRGARRGPCAPRRTRTTTATSPSPTCRRCWWSRRWWRRCAAPCPSCRGRAPRATAPSSASRPTTPPTSPPSAPPPTTSSARSPPAAAGPRRPSGWPTG